MRFEEEEWGNEGSRRVAWIEGKSKQKRQKKRKANLVLTFDDLTAQRLQITSCRSNFAVPEQARDRSLHSQFIHSLYQLPIPIHVLSNARPVLFKDYSTPHRNFGTTWMLAFFSFYTLSHDIISHYHPLHPQLLLCPSNSIYLIWDLACQQN